MNRIMLATIVLVLTRGVAVAEESGRPPACEPDQPVAMETIPLTTDVGTYQNMTTDQTLPIEGSVDKETQRAAWSIGDNRNTVMETGIYNLTQDEIPVLVHFGNQQTQTWLLVRLEEPESEKTPE